MDQVKVREVKVRELATRGVVTAEVGEGLRDAAFELAASEVGALLVYRGIGPVGVLSERGVVRAVVDGVDLDGGPVEDSMSAPPVSIDEDAPVEQAVDMAPLRDAPPADERGRRDRRDDFGARHSGRTVGPRARGPVTGPARELFVVDWAMDEGTQGHVLVVEPDPAVSLDILASYARRGIPADLCLGPTLTTGCPGPGGAACSIARRASVVVVSGRDPASLEMAPVCAAGRTLVVRAVDAGSLRIRPHPREP